MDQKEDTKKTVPDQELQTGQPATGHETKQSIEPARKCQIYGGPNHHGCGCEAKAAKEKSRLDLIILPRLHFGVNGRALCPSPEPDEKLTLVEFEVTCPDCRQFMQQAAAAQQEIQQEIESPEDELEDEPPLNDLMAESCEDFKTLICDIAATLKVIAGDAITIRKFLNEEKTWLNEKEEVKNAVENQN